MITKFIYGVGCMTAAALCCVGAYIWADVLDNWWMAAVCGGSAIVWIYYAMGAVE